MATGYVVELRKILRPTKEVIRRFRNAIPNEHGVDIEFISVEELFRSKTGKQLVLKYPHLLTKETITYDDHSAILRLTDTYKKLSKTMSDKEIAEKYIACICGLYTDKDDVTKWEASVYKVKEYNKYGEPLVSQDDRVEIYVGTDYWPVRMVTEVGFYNVEIHYLGKRVFTKVNSLHKDFTSKETIYANKQIHLDALQTSISSYYKTSKHKINTMKCIPKGHYIEICF